MRLMFLLALVGCKKSGPPVTAEPTSTTATAAVEVVKGPLDQREYEYVQLDNGIRALLIHDPDTDMAAASLEVHVGHYADPQDRQGLAHFLEHMLFMGTDKYPEVDAYNRFINGHGGWSNAGTGGESTGYFFQVEQAHLHGAFERFARFFVSPNLDPAYADRERNAVNSEYSLKIQDHARRIRQVRKATMNPGHPESKFSVGNLDTLGDRGEDTVHSRLIEFYEAQYRPDRMTVAIVGREPTSVLKQWVIEELSQVKGEPAARAARPAPFLPDQKAVRIDMEPLDERRSLELQFVAPEERDLWPAQPHSFVESILGDEGENTLFARLKSKGWIEGLYAATTDGADDYDLITVNFDLSPEGAKHLDAIVTATFDAIEHIEAEGLEAFRLEEEATMADLNFRFAEETPVVNAVQMASDALAWAPPQNVLNYWAVRSDFDAEQIRNTTLAHLNIDNMRMLVTLPAEESGAALDQLEELYQVKYSVRPFTPEERATFAGDSELDIQLPAANPYLPKDTTLGAANAEPGIPKRLDAGSVELWHLEDTSFGVPRAMTQVSVLSPAVRAGGTRSVVTADLYNALLNDSLEEFAYPLRKAGLRYSIGVGPTGLTLQVFGYDDRQGPLLDDLSKHIRSFQVDPARFALVKESLATDWRNSKSRRPIDQTAWAMSETLDPFDASVDVRLPVLEQVTAADVNTLAKALFANANARMLVHGNLTAADAKSLASTVESTLMAGAKPITSLPYDHRIVPDKKEIVRTIEVDHDDSTIFVRYQDTGTDLDTQARWRMLGQLIRTPFFTQLRSEQQLGYVVNGYYSSTDTMPGVSMRIQSTVAGPVTLLERIDAFLTDYEKTLEAMPDDEFKTIRDGLAAQLRESNTQLNQRSDDLSSDLFLGQRTFDRMAVIADRVDTLNKGEMLEMWRQVFQGDSGRLIVRSFGNKHQDERDEADKKACHDEACAAKLLGKPYTRDLLK